MAIRKGITDLEFKKFKESTDVTGQPGIVVLNPDGSAVGAPVGGATSSNQTNGSQKTQIVDAGGEVATVTGGKLDVNATASLAGTALPISGATDAVGVAIVDGSGNQITSFGGGTQYTEGDTDASITGTAIMFETNTGTNSLGVVNASNPLPVSATIDTTGLATTTTDTNTGTIAGDTTSIDAKTPALGQALAAASVPVVLTAAQVTTLTPPAAITGFGTAANQSTIIGHVDGIETLLGTIDTDTSNISTKIDTIAGDTTSIQTAVELLDDTVATDGSATPTKGILIAGQDGTNAQTIKTDVDGNLQVDVLTMPSTTVTATDLDIRPLVNTDVVTAELSAVDNAVLDTIAAKDFATQTTLAALNAKMVTGTDIGDVTINNASGASAVNIQDGGNTITVDGTVSANATLSAETTKVIGTVNIAAAQTLATVTTVGAVTAITNALPAGTNAIGKLSANSGVDIGDVDILSIAAGDNNIGNVDLASAIPAGTNAIGKLIPPDYDVTSHTAKTQKYYTNAGAVTDGIIWSPAAGKRWHVATLTLNISAAATVTIEDDLAGGDSPILKFELAANSGVVIPFGDLYPLTSAEDAADLIITTTAGNVYVTAVGYEI